MKSLVLIAFIIFVFLNGCTEVQEYSDVQERSGIKERSDVQERSDKKDIQLPSTDDSVPSSGAEVQARSVKKTIPLPNTDDSRPLTWHISENSCPGEVCSSDNVIIKKDMIVITVPAGKQGGGEIYSDELFKHGSFEAKMKFKKVPNVIYSFFIGNFYPKPENEIDIVEIEINKNARPIVYSSVWWTIGELLWESDYYSWFKVDEDYHKYKLVWNNDTLDFFIDDKFASRWKDSRLVSMKRMRVYLNAYTYNPKYTANETGYLYIESVKVKDSQ